MMRTVAIAGLSLLLASFSGTARGALLTGTGEAPTAIPGGTVIGFDTETTGLYASITIGGVTFASGTTDPLTIGPDFNGSFNTRGGKSLFNDFDLVPDSFVITFASPVSAFAFNWGASDNIWTLSAFDSSAVLIESHAIAPVFGSNAGDYRGISAAGIKSILITDTKNSIASGDYVFIDQFTYLAGAAAVPEPSSLVLLGVGFTSLAAMRRRRTPADHTNPTI